MSKVFYGTLFYAYMLFSAVLIIPPIFLLNTACLVGELCGVLSNRIVDRYENPFREKYRKSLYGDLQ